MSAGFKVALRNSRLDLITALIDAGATGGVITFYAGARPATGGTATTILAELVMSATSFPAAAAGAMTANAITNDAAANNTGTATWFRIEDSNGLFVMDGDIGVTGSGKDMEVNTVDVVTGVEVSVTAFTITHGNA